MTIEEQRLSEMLHRLTPEPPRRVTVEDVAIRLANKNAPARGARMSGSRADSGRAGGGQPGGFRPRRGRLVPLLAAAAVVVIAGASAGVAVTLSSHTSKTPSAARGEGLSSTVGPASTTTLSPTQSGSTLPSTPPAAAGHPATTGPLLYSVVGTVGVTEATLASDGKSLYAFTTNNLVQLDPGTGKIVHQAPADGFPGQAPVIAGNKVWEVTSYGGSVALSSYNEQTLAADRTIAVPASGSASSDPASVLTAGPNGNLYLAAGSAIEEVDPSSGSVVRQFTLPGTANSVAVSPEGSRIYAGIDGGSYRIAEVNAATGQVVSTVSVGQGQSGGGLVATSGGVWFTTGTGTAERVWFAPATNLSGAKAVSGPSVGGDEAIPTYAGGAVWVGGTKQVQCLDPATGQVRATGTVPYSQVAPAGFGDVVSANGHLYALYVNNRSEQGDAAGSLVMLNPSSACTSGGTSSGGTGS